MEIHPFLVNEKNIFYFEKVDFQEQVLNNIVTYEENLKKEFDENRNILSLLYTNIRTDQQKDTKKTTTNDFPKTKKEITIQEQKVLNNITTAPNLVDNVLFFLSDQYIDKEEFIYQLKFYSIKASIGRDIHCGRCNNINRLFQN